MSCAPADQCAQGEGTNTYGTVDLSNPSVFVPGFQVPNVDAPNFKGTPSTASCTYDSGSGAGTFSCLGANTQHDTVIKFGVDGKTGEAVAEDDVDPTVPLCMTPSCYMPYLVADEQDIDALVL